MDETFSGDSWLSARLGNAIDVLVDRTLNRPQFQNDAGQQYGMGANGQLYQLGQVNGQIVAQVRPTATAINMPLLLVAGVIALVVMGGK